MTQNMDREALAKAQAASFNVSRIINRGNRSCLVYWAPEVIEGRVLHRVPHLHHKTGDLEELLAAHYKTFAHVAE